MIPDITNFYITTLDIKNSYIMNPGKTNLVIMTDTNIMNPHENTVITNFNMKNRAITNPETIILR